MLQAIKDALRSKKAIATIVGVLGWVGSQLLGVPDGAVEPALHLIVAYVIGQGIADHGKESKKLEFAQPLDTLRAIRGDK